MSASELSSIDDIVKIAGASVGLQIALIVGIICGFLYYYCKTVRSFTIGKQGLDVEQVAPVGAQPPSVPAVVAQVVNALPTLPLPSVSTK